MKRVLLEGTAEGVLVASLYVVSHVPKLAKKFRAAVSLEFCVNTAIFGVERKSRYLALGLHLGHEPILQLFEFST